MVVAIFAISGTDVLIAQGGEYLTDKTTIGIDMNMVRDLQRVTTVQNRPVQNTEADKQLARDIFVSRARDLTNSLRTNGGILGTDKVKANSVTWKEAQPANAAKKILALPGRFVTRFIVPIHPPGFVKGTYPDPAYPGETPQQAAAREFQEETGVSLPVSSFMPNPQNPTIFRLSVSPAQKDQIVRTWSAMDQQNLGELFELRWEPISDIYADRTKLNNDSKAIIEFLPSGAGKRSTIRRKTSKRSKRKGTSKRGVRR